MKTLYYSALGILVACMIILNACKKDQVNNNTQSGTTSKYGHVKRYADGGRTIDFKYDANGRMDSFITYNFTDTPVCTLTYNQNSVVLTGGGNTTTFNLNSAGLATSDSHGNVYGYDSNGYLISITNGAGNVKYTIASGNATTITDHNLDGGGTDSNIYVFGPSVEHRDYGISFLGKNATFVTMEYPYENYPISVKSNNLVQQNIDYSQTYYWTYTFDTLGRVTTETVGLAGSNNGSNLYIYTN